MSPLVSLCVCVYLCGEPSGQPTGVPSGQPVGEELARLTRWLRCGLSSRLTGGMCSR